MRPLPDDLRAEIEARLGTSIRSSAPVGGGCINDARLLETASGERAFLKWNPRLERAAFAVEAEGLQALRARGGPRIPCPLAWSSGGPGPGWLVLEYIAPGPPGSDFGARLGEALARIHDPTEGPVGWARDGWIGSLAQANAPANDWASFWRERRLRPQLELAQRHARLDATRSPWPELLARCEDILPSLPRPSLLHGDLWSGNVYADGHGAPVLIDPAVYRGDGAVDLAMASLFGGFPETLFERYHEALGMQEAAAPVRALYQLYPLLVHVNLFGGSYVRAALRAAGVALRGS